MNISESVFLRQLLDSCVQTVCVWECLLGVCVGQYIYETEPVRVQRGCQVMDTPTAAVLICLSSCECIQTCTALLGVYTRLGLWTKLQLKWRKNINDTNFVPDFHKHELKILENKFYQKYKFCCIEHALYFQFSIYLSLKENCVCSIHSLRQMTIHIMHVDNTFNTNKSNYNIQSNWPSEEFKSLIAWGMRDHFSLYGYESIGTEFYKRSNKEAAPLSLLLFWLCVAKE